MGDTSNILFAIS